MSRASRWVCAFVLVWVASCGGKAVIDSAGGGGSSGSSSTNSSSSNSSSSSSVGAGGAAAGVCDEACKAMIATPWCNVDDGCVEVCEAALGSAGACAAQAQAALTCMASEAEATNCWFEGSCASSISAWGDCLGYPASCDSVSINGDPMDCTSLTSCGNSNYEVRCSYFDLAIDCECTIDGLFVGRCSGDFDDPCEPFQGCCSAYF